jgi:hypothetical protein
MQRRAPVEGQELVAANVELVAGLERLGLDTLLRLDCEVDLVQRAADLVDLANGCLQEISLRVADGSWREHVPCSQGRRAR